MVLEENSKDEICGSLKREYNADVRRDHICVGTVGGVVDIVFNIVQGVSRHVDGFAAFEVTDTQIQIEPGEAFFRAGIKLNHHAASKSAAHDPIADLYIAGDFAVLAIFRIVDTDFRPQMIKPDQPVHIGPKGTVSGLNAQQEMAGEEVISGSDIHPYILNGLTEGFCSGIRSVNHNAEGCPHGYRRHGDPVSKNAGSPHAQAICIVLEIGLGKTQGEVAAYLEFLLGI